MWLPTRSQKVAYFTHISPASVLLVSLYARTQNTLSRLPTRTVGLLSLIEAVERQNIYSLGSLCQLKDFLLHH